MDVIDPNATLLFSNETNCVCPADVPVVTSSSFYPCRKQTVAALPVTAQKKPRKNEKFVFKWISGYMALFMGLNIVAFGNFIAYKAIYSPTSLGIPNPIHVTDPDHRRLARLLRIESKQELIVQWMKGFLLRCEADILVVGLRGTGKRSLLLSLVTLPECFKNINASRTGLTEITYNKINFKLCDIGVHGSPEFVATWERYCRRLNAIVYMVDAADQEKIEVSRNELHNLLEKPQLQGIPVLVLGNKRDLPGALNDKGLIQRMNLNGIQHREICCFSISCKDRDNIDSTLQWLIDHSKITEERRE